MDYPKLTLTITSCKRINLLHKTINSFLANCLDLDLIDNIILVDDNSGVDTIAETDYLLTKFNKPFVIINKSENQKGHAQSLNIIWDLIQTDYITHLEDDWEFKVKDNFIRKSLDIMFHDNSIKQVLLRAGDFMAIKQARITLNNFEYIKYNYEGQHVLDMKNRPAWCGFNLNPAIWDFKEIKKLGKFVYQEPCFEYNYSRKFWLAGYKIAYFPDNFCEHLGKDNSAYKLNATNK
jgi:hypothetical protein